MNRRRSRFLNADRRKPRCVSQRRKIGIRPALAAAAATTMAAGVWPGTTTASNAPRRTSCDSSGAITEKKLVASPRVSRRREQSSPARPPSDRHSI